MIRGLLSGVAWGALVTGVGIVGLSLATPLPAPSGDGQTASDTGTSVEEPSVTTARTPGAPIVAAEPDAMPQTLPGSVDTAAADPSSVPPVAPEAPSVSDPVALAEGTSEPTEAPAPQETASQETVPQETAPDETVAEAPAPVEAAPEQEAPAQVAAATPAPEPQPVIETSPTPAPATSTEQFTQPATPEVSALPGTDVAVVLPQVAAPAVTGPAVAGLAEAPVLDTQSSPPPVVNEATPRATLPRENGLPQISQTIDAEAPPPSFQPAPLEGEAVVTPQVGIARETTAPAAPQPAPEPTPAPMPEAVAVAEATPSAIEPAPTQIAEAVGAPVPSEAPDLATPAPQVAGVTPRILELGQEAPGTSVGRFAMQGGLTTNSAGVGRPVAALVPSVNPAAQEETAPAPEPALVSHSVPFERVRPDTPLVSIILIDTPESRLDRTTLVGFPFPVTFAIDATQPDAAEAVRSYRANGFEVVLLADGLPQEGNAQDLEVAFEGAVQIVDEAVAVVDSQDGFLQNTRVALDTVLGRLQQSGHGFVSFPQGLNVAQAAARRAGVPGRTVFRVLDAEQENSSVITRYLDRATLAAGQEGHVIVLGHSYADTVTAIYSWHQSIRGQSVEVAPISYVLQQYGR